MFPIRDHNPSERTPYVTYALIALNVVIFLSYWPLFDDQRALGAFYDTWGMRPIEVSNGIETYTLLTSMFLHGGLMHLVGNMLFLWVFGDNLEDQMGHVPFLIFYLASGIGADLGQLLADPSSPVPVVGASGAIMQGASLWGCCSACRFGSSAGGQRFGTPPTDIHPIQRPP